MMTPSLDWLDDPEIFRVNQVPAHSDHVYFASAVEAKTQQSSLSSC